MTIGIYILRFNNTTKVYVGQSVDTYARYLQHMYKLRKGLHQPKLQAAYAKYGMPSYEIICECSADELDTYENEAIQLWDAINNGYNFQKDSSFHGPRLAGGANKKAQYSNDTYIAVLLKLAISNASIKEIAAELDVNINVVYQINNGSSHRSWLEPLFPEAYTAMRSKIGKRRSKYMNTEIRPILLYGDIEEEMTTSIEEFASKHNLNSAHLGAVLSGKLAQHKGWVLKETNELY